MLKVGICGLKYRQQLYKTLDVAELQDTFYNMPDPDNLRKLRQEAPSNFEFTVKVFQAITHPRTSPTWRRMKTRLEGNLENYGYLRPTEENFKIWDEFYKRTRVLNVRVYVFQTPASMPANEDVLRWVIDFFKSIKRSDIVIGWEPRGAWCEKRDLLQKVLEECDIVHIVDPFRRLPYRDTKIVYFRLHGIGPGETNYSYKYTDEDLRKLSSIVKSYLDKSCEVYVLFNNIYMFQDAQRFKQIMIQSRQ